MGVLESTSQIEAEDSCYGTGDVSKDGSGDEK